MSPESLTPMCHLTIEPPVRLVAIGAGRAPASVSDWSQFYSERIVVFAPHPIRLMPDRARAQSRQVGADWHGPKLRGLRKPTLVLRGRPPHAAARRTTGACPVQRDTNIAMPRGRAAN